jgi:fimbrial chaperone protein
MRRWGQAMTIKSSTIGSLLVALLASAPTVAQAASLNVAPVTIEVAAPGATAILTLRNDGERPLNAQIRVFRWTQVDGEEKLVPSEDVVASPPVVSLQAKADYTVRIVRVTKGAVSGEEAYRLIVDELPDPARQRNGVVNIVLRYSVPIFFTTVLSADPKLNWEIQQRDGRAFVVASNSGARRVRISRLKIQDAKGATASFGDGLTGYVLGQSTMRWAFPRNAPKFNAGGSAVISAQGDIGPINTTASTHMTR